MINVGEEWRRGMESRKKSQPSTGSEPMTSWLLFVYSATQKCCSLKKLILSFASRAFGRNSFEASARIRFREIWARIEVVAIGPKVARFWRWAATCHQNWGGRDATPTRVPPIRVLRWKPEWELPEKCSPWMSKNAKLLDQQLYKLIIKLCHRHIPWILEGQKTSAFLTNF